MTELKHDLLAESKMYWWLPPSFKETHIPDEVKKHLDDMVEKEKKEASDEGHEELCRGHDEKEPLIREDLQACDKTPKSGLLGMFFEDEENREEECQDTKKRRVSNRQYTKGEFVPAMLDVCGPPLRKIMPWATLCQLCATVLLPLLAFYVSSCVGKEEMYATYPRWLWIPFIPWLIIMSLLDWRCFTYTVVPKIAMLERFTLGPLRVTFRQWTCYIAVKSIITHAEVWSQGLLVASALRARDCRGWKGLESLWSTSWKQSMFYHTFPQGEHLWFLAGLSWGFLVLQHILYILRAFPMRPGTEYHCASEKDGYMVWICCSRIWHADALNTLANSNRMVAVQYGTRKYSVYRAFFKLKNDKLGSFFHILKMDMRIFLWDMVFVNLLQTCAKLVFQTALWCLLRSTDHEVFWKASPVVLKTFVPLCLAHVTSFMSFCSNLIDWLEVRETRVKVRKERGKDMNLADFREYDKLATFERLVGAILMLQILFQILYAVKFVKSFQCDYGLWNLNVGCVNIEPTPSGS